MESSYLTIFFNTSSSHSPPLTIPVLNVEHEMYDGSSQNFGARSTRYQLNTEKFSLDEPMLVKWASLQMKLEDDGFQSALDNLVISCMAYDWPDTLPHVSTGLTIF